MNELLGNYIITMKKEQRKELIEAIVNDAQINQLIYDEKLPNILNRDIFVVSSRQECEKIVKKITVFANNFEEDKFVHNAQISATVYVDEQTKYRSVVDEKEFKTTYFSIVQTCEKEGANLKKDE